MFTASQPTSLALKALNRFKAKRSQASLGLSIPANRLASYVKRNARPFSFGGYTFLFFNDFAVFRLYSGGRSFVSWGLQKT